MRNSCFNLDSSLMRATSIIFACLLAAPGFARAADSRSLADLTQQALQQSQLTLPGGKPFHLKAIITEKDEPDSDYSARIEEYWVSPSKWRRVITSSDFSQTVIENGDAVSEKNDDDYFPVWLRNFVTAITDEVPASMLDVLKGVKSQIPAPSGSENSSSCANLPAKVDRWVICFEGSHALFHSVFSKGYSAEFLDYRKFGNRWVPYIILDYPEPGTTVQAQITELTELTVTAAEAQLFEVRQATPPDQRISSVRIDEDTMRKMSLDSTDITWPSVGEGLLKGECAVYVSADRAGKVREVLPEGCDNAAMEEPLRQAVMKWHLRPAVSNGVPVQVEALLGFPFQTTLDSSKSLPELSDAEVRALASDIVEPVFPPDSAPKGTEFIVQISVDETGKLTGIQNPHELKSAVFLAAYTAVGKWHFKPYVKDGKPQYFHADLSFHMQ